MKYRSNLYDSTAYKMQDIYRYLIWGTTGWVFWLMMLRDPRWIYLAGLCTLLAMMKEIASGRWGLVALIAVNQMVLAMAWMQEHSIVRLP